MAATDVANGVADADLEALEHDGGSARRAVHSDRKRSRSSTERPPTLSNCSVGFELASLDGDHPPQTFPSGRADELLERSGAVKDIALSPTRVTVLGKDASL